MESLFDLNDFEEDENIINETINDKIETIDKNIQQEDKEKLKSKNLYQIETNKDLHKKYESNETDKVYEKNIISPKNGERISLNEGKKQLSENIQTNSNINNEAKQKVGKKKNAVEDIVPISEYDKIESKAIEFPFELDVFQKRSIIRLERHEVSILYI